MFNDSTFLSAAQSLCSSLGKPATYTRGSTTVNTNGVIDAGVYKFGEFGQVIGVVTTIVFPKADLPGLKAQRGDTAVIDGVTYIVESVKLDDGYAIEVVING